MCDDVRIEKFSATNFSFVCLFVQSTSISIIKPEISSLVNTSTSNPILPLHSPSSRISLCQKRTFHQLLTSVQMSKIPLNVCNCIASLLIVWNFVFIWVFGIVDDCGRFQKDNKICCFLLMLLLLLLLLMLIRMFAAQLGWPFFIVYVCMFGMRLLSTFQATTTKNANIANKMMCVTLIFLVRLSGWQF